MPKGTGLIPAGVYDGITETRIFDPGLPLRMAERRRRRRELAPDGRLAMLAADHPARMVTSIRGDPLRMGDRRELLSSIARLLTLSKLDGIMATADIIDELFIIEKLSAGSPAAKMLDRKVVVGSMNRGGLAGSVFELDDALTGYDAAGIASMGLDGGKFLLRFDPAVADSRKTLAYCARAIRECGSGGIPIFVEPLPVVSHDGSVKVVKDAASLVKLIGVVTGLSSSTSRVWLKLPFCEGFERVARSTTLPILLLGGEATDDLGALLSEIEIALKSGTNVRGVLMGRSILYPPAEDPVAVADAVCSVVHRGFSASRALKALKGRDPVRRGR